MSESPDPHEPDDEATGVETSSTDDGDGDGDGDALPPEEVERIEAERAERLDPENRPENAEVDNTDRDFDTTTGQFTDHEPDPDLGPYADPE